MKICWNAIVRNEAARIERCMHSLIFHVDCAVILDTGSSDETVSTIRKFFDTHGKPCEILHGPFDDFGSARNRALEAARVSHFEWDYALLLDADMELRGNIPPVSGAAYQIEQRAGSLHYYNTRLLSRAAKARYVGVTHEYLEVDAGLGTILPDKLYALDHADGANRAEKFQRDILLLHKALKDEPDNPRYWFYLAQSHRDAGETDAALTAYRKRVELGGWEEEVWNAQCNVAACLKTQGDEDGFVREMLKAYDMRPQRAEALYDLAKHYREKGMNRPAALFSKQALDTPRPDDVLFVNDFVYSVGAKEEFSIAAFYDQATRAAGFSACDAVALGTHGAGASTEQARNNLFHYLPKAAEILPSFVAREIPLTPSAGWAHMNPSIARFHDSMYCVLRMVNYQIGPGGTYDINGKGGAITEENPIRTRNFLLRLDRDLNVKVRHEIEAPKADDFKLVRGWEDMRLFVHANRLCVSAAVREARKDGMPEQWWGRLSTIGDVETVVEAQRLPMFQVCEKNWMPVAGPDVRWLHSLNMIVNGGASPTPAHKFNVSNLRGGSQVIRYRAGYLCIVHEASMRPDGQRYYWHRFVILNDALKPTMISKPFVFHDKQIEFCAGLCRHPDGKRLVISYGVCDSSAWLATVDEADVERFMQ